MLLKLKTFELLLKLFCLFGSFRNGFILFLHIEGFYKVIVIGSDADKPIALYFVSNTDIARLSQFGGVMPFDLQKSHISL